MKNNWRLNLNREKVGNLLKVIFLNSKFQEFETVRTLNIQKNDQIWTNKIS